MNKAQRLHQMGAVMPRERVWFESRESWGTFTLIELIEMETADGMLRAESEHRATIRHRKGLYSVEIKKPGGEPLILEGYESLEAAKAAVCDRLGTLTY